MTCPARARFVTVLTTAVRLNVSGLSRVGCCCSQAMMRSARTTGSAPFCFGPYYPGLKRSVHPYVVKLFAALEHSARFDTRDLADHRSASFPGQAVQLAQHLICVVDLFTHSGANRPGTEGNR